MLVFHLRRTGFIW